MVARVCASRRGGEGGGSGRSERAGDRGRGALTLDDLARRLEIGELGLDLGGSHGAGALQTMPTLSHATTAGAGAIGTPSPAQRLDLDRSS